MLSRRVWVVVAFVLTIGCTSAIDTHSFDEEYRLTLRAGRGELTESDKAELLRRNHPILAQIGDPQVQPVLTMFAKLTPELQEQLQRDSYLKWQFRELPRDSQQATASAIRFVIQARYRGVVTGDTDPFTATLDLGEVESGFAIVDLPKTGEKVVSWFAFGPGIPSPLWLTIVNSPLSISRDGEYRQAHLDRLPLLRSMKSSRPPPPPAMHVTWMAHLLPTVPFAI